MVAEPSNPLRRVKVAFRTLGCKVNRVESDSIAAELIGRGATISSENEADVVVINTCTVTGEADAKARKAVRHALEEASSPVVVVTGCLAALDAPALRALGPRVIVEPEKKKVAALVAHALTLGPGGSEPMSQADARLKSADGFRTRAMLKIEDGCDNFCTYCIIPYARGVPRATPLEAVVAEAAALVGAGVREIVLTGINIGRYSHDGADLADLVEAVADTGVQRLRLSSIEPPDIGERLLAALSANTAVCEHLHVPLQSGSDRVLRTMGRTYDVQEYERLISGARAALPGLAVTTDVIAGFPGETDEDHAATMAFIECIGFSKLHVFRYSPRKGTPAAEMAQVPPDIRVKRASELRSVGERLRAEHISTRLGCTSELLVECVVDGIASGTTRDYLRAHVTMPAASPGDIVAVRLVRGDADRLIGEPVI